MVDSYLDSNAIFRSSFGHVIFDSRHSYSAHSSTVSDKRKKITAQKGRRKGKRGGNERRKGKRGGKKREEERTERRKGNGQEIRKERK